MTNPKFRSRAARPVWVVAIALVAGCADIAVPVTGEADFVPLVRAG